LEADIYSFSEGKRQNSIGTWKGTESATAKSLLFNGHLDTNPVTEGWTIDPWEGKIDKDFVYGIGISNMKSGCAAYFCAVEALKSAGWTLKGDVILTFVVGELQGGVGTLAAIEQGLMKADYFINCEPSDIRAVTMHAEALMFDIELIGESRHMSAREEATDAIDAVCTLIPKLNRMVFSGAKRSEHLKCNRCQVGVVHGALGKDLVEWRPSQVAGVYKLAGSARYAPGQTQDGVVDDIRKVIEAVREEQFPRLKYELRQRFEDCEGSQ
jgi:acetylornithine deacetylase